MEIMEKLKMTVSEQYFRQLKACLLQVHEYIAHY